jgi:methionine-rich copper-binding protein CopC
VVGPVVAVVVMLLVGVVSTVLALPAMAHARFVGSDPAEGARLAEAPGSVVMSYSEEISPQFVDTAVVPPGQEPVVTEAVVAGSDVTVEIAAAGVDLTTPGEWQVVARVVSADGHPVEHTARFVVEAAAAPAATTEPADDEGVEPTAAATDEAAVEATEEPADPATSLPDDPADALRDGVPTWLGVLLALGVAGAGAAAVVVVLRRRDSGG